MPIPEAATMTMARGEAEIDLELFTFVERFATNLTRWDLILWFGKSPDAAWTAEQVAEQLQRAVFATTKELDDLTYLRVLVRQYTPQRTTYRLSKRGNIRRAATRLANLDAKPMVSRMA